LDSVPPPEEPAAEVSDALPDCEPLPEAASPDCEPSPEAASVRLLDRFWEGDGIETFFPHAVMQIAMKTIRETAKQRDFLAI
jgi:hypothetical protein